MREAHERIRGSAGSQAIADIITAKGTKLSRYRATNQMKLLDLVNCHAPTHRYKKAVFEHVEIPNYLSRQFTITKPNQILVGDVTYLWANNRWTYLAVVMDLFARKPVG